MSGPPRARVLRCLAGQRGTSVVEYAIVIIFFLTFLFGIIGFSHALYVYHFVNNSAKEATRWAAVNGSTCAADSSCNGTAPMNSGPANAADVDTFVQAHIPPGIDSTKVATTACGVVGQPKCADSTPTVCTTTPNSPTCTVKVTVAYPFQFTVPLLPATSTTTAPCTQPGICLSSASEMIIVH